jgi:FxsC-like protein
LPYSYFLSYARADHNAVLSDFHHRLRDAVFPRVGGNRDEIGFFDLENIDPGCEWRESLFSALADARSMVPIYTASYFERENCGREWGAFRKRMVAHDALAEPVLFPILWAGSRIGNFSTVARELEYYQPPQGVDREAYRDIGLGQMLQISRFDSDCKSIIADLAVKIVAAKDARLGPLPPGSFADIANAFAPPLPAVGGPPAAPALSPDTVQIVVVAGNADELRAIGRAVGAYGSGAQSWMPFDPPNRAKIVALAQNVVSGLNWTSTLLPLDQDLVAQLERAEDENRIIVLIVDAWTLRIERYRTLMSQFDDEGRRFLNCILMLPWNVDDPETSTSCAALRELMQSTFAKNFTARDPLVFVDEVTSSDSFSRLFSQALEATRGRILQMSRARGQGTGTNGLPILNGG